eukprot:CAMPEP_0182926670 /NCGR_PEP_ID=MMETSP0105_2-20130417/12199_1 /TAXON_ID=81532 ORGANISM="Acanthoeca-like sp., Strain 10tr" /NCGR_SAMPLE_ID=MMETSP0105_2 /ASSEMBLY_ACC=CAM_ASM_000205 /LENGTH=895 /DNA_ID=CAMNT_0025064571 /DNA_START=14 /DNA_END=2701 /DNA_ORIENTATION=+
MAAPGLVRVGVLVASAVGLASAGCTVDGSITCFADSITGRVFSGGNVNSDSPTANSIELCAQFCANLSKPYAGVEYGAECYCGSEFPSSAKPSTSCNRKCTGNSQEFCGGFDAIGVYKYTCSGTPIPAPPSPSLMVNPCLAEPYKSMKFCDASAPIDDRVNDAVSRMSLEEKIPNLDTGAPAIPSLGLNAYNWWSESSTGISHNRVKEATKFAFPITTGMSFNRTLWLETGRAIGKEARATMNDGKGFSTFWAPVVNLAREPRWGRNIEVPSEDPYHSGEYAEFYVKGMEQNPEDPNHIMASACCKHYVANSMDGTTSLSHEHHDRNHYDATISQQDLIDSYMVPFQSCVEKGKVSGLMCSYNSVNGVPSCANHWLLTEVAREEWGFDGYVTSDCDADNDVVFSHHYTDVPEQGVQDVLRAGTDVDCGRFVGTYAMSALNKSYITEQDIDTRLKYLFRVRMRLGHFDPPGPLQQIPESTVCSDESIAVSMEGPRQSAALLKNENAALPLSVESSGTVFVVGPNANLSKSDAGYYGPGSVCNGNFWTMVDAVSQYAKSVTTALGVPDVESNDMSQIPAAVEMAKAADTVVLAVGTDLSWGREGHDATSIAFSDGQLALIGNVSAAAKNPVILVTLTATPLDISSMLTNPKIGAILHVGQPSVTALSLGDVLFGKVSPAGRTVQTIYPAAYADEISIFDFAMRPGPSPFARPDCTMSNGSDCPKGTNPGRTYRFYTGNAVVPFGFGLSYTTFTYSLSSSTDEVSLNAVRDMVSDMATRNRRFPDTRKLKAGAPLVQYNVTVTNTGKVDADDVVLGFITPPNAGQNGNPIKQLFGFERVHVPAGQSISVYLYPEMTEFAPVNEAGERSPVTGDYKVQFGLPETSTLGMGLAEHILRTF